MTESRRRIDGQESRGDDFVFELALFLLTSARGCIDEPPIYGPFRLIDALSRLAAIYKHTDSLNRDEFLIKTKSDIDAKKFVVMQSKEEFVKFIEELIIKFSEELKRRRQA